MTPNINVTQVDVPNVNVMRPAIHAVSVTKPDTLHASVRKSDVHDANVMTRVGHVSCVCVTATRSPNVVSLAKQENYTKYMCTLYIICTFQG